jgi:hypothetical protein
MEMLIRLQHRLFPMPEPQAFRRFAQTAQKWRDLVDQRCAHFIELHRTGRWKHYCDETQFLLLMRERRSRGDLVDDCAAAAGRQRQARPPRMIL